MKANFSKISQIVLLGAMLAMFAGCAQEVKPAGISKSYAFWPPFPEEPRILYLASYSSNTDIEPARSKLDEEIYGKQQESELMINHPYGVAMWNGRIYVCDTKNPAIIVLDLRKKRMELMGAGGESKLVKPIAIAISADGEKYVSDDQIGAIAVFDAADHMVRQIGHANFRPVGLAVHGDELYASDFKANHIEVFNRHTGKLLRTISEGGIKKGQVIGPLGVAADAQGNVYVDDILNCHVQKFGPDGKVLGVFGSLGDRPGSFTRPKHIAVDNDGVIYVVDGAFQNVQMFDQQFRPLMYFGSPGVHPGAMDMPAGISVHEGDLDIFADKIPDAFLAQRLILVTNQFGDNRVSIYAMGHLKPGKTINDLGPGNQAIPEGTTTQPTTGIGGAVAAPAD
jgi:hypothetical protein